MTMPPVSEERLRQIREQVMEKIRNLNEESK